MMKSKYIGIAGLFALGIVTSGLTFAYGPKPPQRTQKMAKKGDLPKPTKAEVLADMQRQSNLVKAMRLQRELNGVRLMNVPDYMGTLVRACYELRHRSLRLQDLRCLNPLGGACRNLLCMR